MSRFGTAASEVVGRRVRGLGGALGTRGRSLAAAIGVVGAYRPLETLYTALDVATTQYAPVVGAALLTLAAGLAFYGARDDNECESFGAGVVGAGLLLSVVTVGAFGRFEAFGPGVLSVGLLAVLGTATTTGIVATWTVRAAGSPTEALAFGTPVVFPLLAGPWFAAFAPEAAPAFVGGNAAAVLALAAGITLTVGVAHGLYRRSRRLLARTDPDGVGDHHGPRDV
jgi:hypothetical protein